MLITYLWLIANKQRNFIIDILGSLFFNGESKSYVFLKMSPILWFLEKAALPLFFKERFGFGPIVDLSTGEIVFFRRFC